MNTTDMTPMLRFRNAVQLFIVLLALTVGSSAGLRAQGNGEEISPPPAPGDSARAARDHNTNELKASPSSGQSFDGSLQQAPAAPGRYNAYLDGSFGTVLPLGPLGATVGGAQDIGYARALIDAGQVPGFVDFSPEGLYSEHDIPTPSSTCTDKLCLSLGYGFAPAADSKSSALFVHLGMTSGVRPEDFKRPSLHLALVVDVSGSMEGEKIAMVKSGLRRLVANLGPEDVVTLIAFSDEARVLTPPMALTDTAALMAAIDGLAVDGGTNIEAALSAAFSLLDGLTDKAGYAKRVMLFTDAMPNAGRTDSASFRALTERYAREGIGLTAFGVGLEFGGELVYHISQLRGGNSFYLGSEETVEKILGEEFDYLVTPIVYDLKVKIRTPEGLRLADVYGLPTWKPGDRDALLEVPTVFFSSNRGAIVLRYERDDAAPLTLKRGDLLADGSLSYTDVDGKQRSNGLTLKHDSKKGLKPGMQFYTHDGMRTAVALTNVFYGLRDGTRLYTEGKSDEALRAIGRSIALVDLENITLFDAGLSREVAMLTKLAENIKATSASIQTPGDSKKSSSK